MNEDEGENPTVLRRSIREKTSIKRSLYEKTLFQETQGPRKNGTSMRTTISILEEVFEQSVITGYKDNEQLFQYSKGISKRFDQNALTLNALK